MTGKLREHKDRDTRIVWFAKVAKAVATVRELREVALQLLFCVAWSALYPVWRSIGVEIPGDGTPMRAEAFAWPYSALWPLGYGLIPAVTFVWLGYLLYVLSRPGMMQEPSVYRLLGGLSASVNILLVATVVLLFYFRSGRVGMNALMRRDFYATIPMLHISVPIALSLFVALFSTLPRNPRIGRRRRLARGSIRTAIRPVSANPGGQSRKAEAL